MTTDILTRIQALPQELQDEVLEYAIVPDTGIIDITKPFKLPLGLQLNRATRTTTAKTFYGNTIFLELPDRPRSLDKWLSSLTVEHRLLVRHMRHRYEGGILVRRGNRSAQAFQQFARMMLHLVSGGIRYNREFVGQSKLEVDLANGRGIWRSDYRGGAYRVA